MPRGGRRPRCKRSNAVRSEGIGQCLLRETIITVPTARLSTRHQRLMPAATRRARHRSGHSRSVRARLAGSPFQRELSRSSTTERPRPPSQLFGDETKQSIPSSQSGQAADAKRGSGCDILRTPTKYLCREATATGEYVLRKWHVACTQPGYLRLTFSYWVYFGKTKKGIRE